MAVFNSCSWKRSVSCNVFRNAEEFSTKDAGRTRKPVGLATVHRRCNTFFCWWFVFFKVVRISGVECHNYRPMTNWKEFWSTRSWNYSDVCLEWLDKTNINLSEVSCCSWMNSDEAFSATKLSQFSFSVALRKCKCRPTSQATPQTFIQTVPDINLDLLAILTEIFLLFLSAEIILAVRPRPQHSKSWPTHHPLSYSTLHNSFRQINLHQSKTEQWC